MADKQLVVLLRIFCLTTLHLSLVVPGAEKPTCNASGDKNRAVDRNSTADSVSTGSDKAEDRTSQAESGNGDATQFFL